MKKRVGLIARRYRELGILGMPRLKLKKDVVNSNLKKNETLRTNLSDNQGKANQNSRGQKRIKGGKDSKALTIKEILAKMKMNGSSSEKTKGGGGLQNEGWCKWEARGDTDEGDKGGKETGN